MKKFSSSFIIVLIILVNLFAPISVLFDGSSVRVGEQKAEAADTCDLVSSSITPTGYSSKDISEIPQITLKARTTNCIGYFISFQIQAQYVDKNGTNQVESVLNVWKNETGREVEIKYADASFTASAKPEISKCNNGSTASNHCKVFYRLLMRSPQGTLKDFNGQGYFGSDTKGEYAEYNCTQCKNNINKDEVFQSKWVDNAIIYQTGTNPISDPNAECKILSAVLAPSAGDVTKPDWIKTATVTLSVVTSGCIGKDFTGAINETSKAINWEAIKIDKFIITQNSFSIDFRPGENEGTAVLIGCPGNTCTVGFDINADGGKANLKKDNIFSYRCSGDSCDGSKKWSYLTNESRLFSWVGKTLSKDSINVEIVLPEENSLDKNDIVTVSISDINNKEIESVVFTVAEIDFQGIIPVVSMKESLLKTFQGLKPATTYIITVIPKLKKFPELTASSKTLTTFNEDGTPVAGSTTTTTFSTEAKYNPDPLPECSMTSGSGILACLAWILYGGIFVPTAYLFGYAGNLLDAVFDHSVNDSFYKSAFITQGWGVIRDVCNIFFIFVLLYIAFSTIIGVHGFNTKSMVVNVVMIGLLINFSLFATQIIIDASNILARVFYNSQTIKIVKNDAVGSGAGVSPDNNGVLRMSEAIINKVNPQNLIVNGVKKTGSIQKYDNQVSRDSDSVTSGTFIIVVLFSIVLNIVGIWVFLSVSLLFIGRIIGLWMAMILSPFAFFSYTVPGLSGTKNIGWKAWWPETIKLAFMAPIFVFMMYLIIKFLETGLGLVGGGLEESTGMEYIIKVTLPFIFIMMLMIKSKDLAKDMAGEVGQAATKGVAAAGVAAVGLAAGGVALGGRAFTRKLITPMTQTEEAKHLATQKMKYNKELETWEKGNRSTPKPSWDKSVHNPRNKQVVDSAAHFTTAQNNHKIAIDKWVAGGSKVKPDDVIKSAEVIKYEADKKQYDLEYDKWITNGSIIGQSPVAPTKSNGVTKYEADIAKYNTDHAAWVASGSPVKPVAPKLQDSITAKTGITDKKKLDDLEKAALMKNGKTVDTGNFGMRAGVGSYINRQQLKLSKTEHGRHKMDEYMKSAGYDGKEYETVGGMGQDKVKTQHDIENKSKIADKIKTGDLTDLKYTTANDAENVWKKNNRANTQSKYINDEIRDGRRSAGDPLTDKDNKNIADQLDIDYKAHINPILTKELSASFKHFVDEAKQQMSLPNKAIANLDKSTFDVRNISSIKIPKEAGIMGKLSLLGITKIAAGVRLGMKTSGIDMGKAQGDFFKDLGSTIEGALKDIKVNIPKSSSGGGGDSHGGGGAHH